MRFAQRTWITAALAAVAACGGSNSSTNGPDAAPAPPDAPTGFQPAPHMPLPLLTPHSGKVIAHPQLVTITFDATDDLHTALESSFGDAIVQSPWLTTVGADWGVDTVGSTNTTVDIGAAPASITGQAAESLILSKITDGTLPAPTAGGDQHIYMLYVPRKVTLGADLQGECGHHAAATAKGVEVSYAVILDPDPQQANCGDVSGITVTASHELIEAASDPYNPPNDGWWVDEALPSPWYMVVGENGDLCNDDPITKSGTFPVQRIYSNTAAKAGRSPCVPFDPDDTYNSVAVDPPTMPTIPAGGSATFTLTGWSTDAMPDWKLVTYSTEFSDLTDVQVNAMLSGTMINNGKTVTLTLHAPSNAVSGKIGGVYVASGQYYRSQPVGFIVK